MNKLLFFLIKMSNIQPFPVTLCDPIPKLDQCSDSNNYRLGQNKGLSPIFRKQAGYCLTLFPWFPVFLNITYIQQDPYRCKGDKSIGYTTKAYSYSSAYTFP